LKYTRKTELRRLCEILRTHLNNLSKYAQQQHSIDLKNVESLNMHLETRFVQLAAATELDLWQEAFRSVEDIHSLLIMAERVPNSKMLITYFEKLTKIFLVADNMLFHASAWNEYFNHVRAQSKPPGEEELKRCERVLNLKFSFPPFLFGWF
jgi:translation initiation factor 3 subunit A